MTFFFDNTFSKKLCAAIGAMMDGNLDVEVAHLQQYYDADTPDVDWIPGIAGKGWIALTNDHRIRTRLAEVEARRSLDLIIGRQPPDLSKA